MGPPFPSSLSCIASSGSGWYLAHGEVVIISMNDTSKQGTIKNWNLNLEVCIQVTSDTNLGDENTILISLANNNANQDQFR